MSSARESPSFIHETEDGSTLRLEWDNRRVRKDRFTYWFLAIFWIIWAPVTVFVTVLFLEQLFAKGFHLEDLVSGLPAVIWLIFGWLGTLLIPWCLLGRSWREWIEISEEEVCHGREGLLAPRPRHFPIATIECIFLGYDGRESIVTLSIFFERSRFALTNRRVFGYWLTPELKEELFDRIETFVREKRLPLQTNKE